MIRKILGMTYEKRKFIDDAEKQESAVHFKLTNQRIDEFANLALGGEEYYKQIIKNWLLIDQSCFDNNSHLFLEAEVYINQSKGTRRSKARVNAYQFFSYVGTIKHMLSMRDYINNRALERKLLEKDDFFAFRLAASRGNVGVLKLLWQCVNNKSNVKKKLLASRGYIDGFIDAAANHNLSTLRLLITFAGGEMSFRKRFSEESFFGENRICEDLLLAFRYAATRGNVDVVNLLLELIDVEEVSYLVTKRKSKFFFDVAEAGHADILKLLWGTVGHKESKRDLLGSERHYIFYLAARGGHVEVVKLLLQFADESDVLYMALTTKKCEAFRVAAFRGYVDIVKLFLDKKRYLGEEFLKAKNYYAFFSAARNGHVEMVRLLWEITSHDNDLKHKLLMTDNCRAFREAAEKGHVGMLELLWQLAAHDVDLRHNFLSSCGTYDSYGSHFSCAFGIAVQNDHIDVVKLLWKFADDTVRVNFLTRGDSQAFYFASEEGYVGVARLLWDLADLDDDIRRGFLTAKDCRAFVCAARKGQVEVVKLLYDFAGNYENLKVVLLEAAERFVFSECVQKGNVEVVKLLLDFANSEKDIKQGSSCLCTAFNLDEHTQKQLIASAATNCLIRYIGFPKNIEDIGIKKIIDYGADVNACNGEGESIIELLITSRCFSWNESYASTIPVFLLDSGAIIRQKNIVCILGRLNDRVYLYPLIDRIFKIVKEQGLEFNVDEAFKHSPGLKIRYQNFLDNSDSQISVCSSKATLFNKRKMACSTNSNIVKCDKKSRPDPSC